MSGTKTKWEKLTLHVETFRGKITFRVLSTQKLERMMLSCADQLHIPIEKLEFSYKGHEFTGEDTVESLQISNNDLIDVEICTCKLSDI